MSQYDTHEAGSVDLGGPGSPQELVTFAYYASVGVLLIRLFLKEFDFRLKQKYPVLEEVKWTYMVLHPMLIILGSFGLGLMFSWWCVNLAKSKQCLAPRTGQAACDDGRTWLGTLWLLQRFQLFLVGHFPDIIGWIALLPNLLTNAVMGIVLYVFGINGIERREGVPAVPGGVQPPLGGPPQAPNADGNGNEVNNNANAQGNQNQGNQQNQNQNQNGAQQNEPDSDDDDGGQANEEAELPVDGGSKQEEDNVVLAPLELFAGVTGLYKTVTGYWTGNRKIKSKTVGSQTPSAQTTPTKTAHSSKTILLSPAEGVEDDGDNEVLQKSSVSSKTKTRTISRRTSRVSASSTTSGTGKSKGRKPRKSGNVC